MTTATAAREGEHILIYTDGSCDGPRGVGGYAAILLRMDGSTELKKHPVRGRSDRETTNVRMEMTAAALALEVVKPGEPQPIVIYSDSRLVVDGMTCWISGWIANGWKKSDRKTVENRDLWERILAAAAGKTVEWRWVKGHAGNQYNAEADRLARAQMEQAKAEFYGFA